MKLSRNIRKALLYALVLPFFGGVGGGLLTSCSETDSTWNPYANWKERNAAWYEQITDSARTAISQAKRTYGDAWEEHCEWRQFKTVRKAENYNSGDICDSVCVHVIKNGVRDENAMSPFETDTVRLSFRGYLMETQYENADGTLQSSQYIFDQSYYGPYDEATAAPALMPVAALTEGFSTALQHMVPGDDWLVYVPQQLAYGSGTGSGGGLPAYSTLLFRIQLVAVYRAGSGVPDWK